MALISGTIPSLINGVSQQPATLRLPTQGEIQENGLSHIARGLEKRPCTEHITEIAGVTSNDSNDVFIHTIRRSEDEAYALIIKGGTSNDAEVKLIDITGYATGNPGGEVFITQDDTDSNITASAAIDTTARAYLSNFTASGTDIFRPNKLSATTIADFTFILNKTQYIKQSSVASVAGEPAAPRDYESLVYFKIGDFGADYKIVIKEFRTLTDNGEPETKTPTLTFTGATSDIITTSADHGLVNDDTVTLTGGDLPAGLAEETLYYVLTTPSTDTLTLSTTKDGTAVDITDTGTGTHTLNKTVIFTTEFVWQTPDNKVKSRSGGEESPNNESINNQQAVVVGNIAYNIYDGGTTKLTQLVELAVIGGATDPKNIRVVTASDGTTTYTGKKGVIDHGSYSGYTGGLSAFSAASTSKGQYFTVKDSDGDALDGTESIIHISNSAYPFTVEVTDGKGDTYMRALNGSDEVAKFGYLPGSKVPEGFVAKISGAKDQGQDDYYVHWVSGVWKETARPRYPGGLVADQGGAARQVLVDKEARTTLDSASMPVQLYKNFGTVNGVADSIYFTLKPITWSKRTVGDSSTNPFPSFGNYSGSTDATDALYVINDIFFHRNRLGFVSDENVILSEAGEYFNFFHTTVLSVLDTAVIDVAVSNNQVAILKSAIPFQENLVLFSDLQQFKLTSDQFLTPTSVTVDVATNFETSTDAKPVPAGKTIFFPFQRGAYSGIREYFIDIASETNDANEVSAHVPEYIEGTVKKMAVSSNEEVLLVLSDSNRKELTVYKYYYNDKEKLQSAWSKWKFDAEIIDVEFIGSVAFILFRRGNGSNDEVYLEKLNLSVDSASAILDDKIGVRLDRRVKLTSEDLLVDSTPTPSAAWEFSETYANVVQTSTSGSGTGRKFSITTDSAGNPTVITTTLGTGYNAGETIVLTEPEDTPTVTVTLSDGIPYSDVTYDKITTTVVEVQETETGGDQHGRDIKIRNVNTSGDFVPRIGQLFNTLADLTGSEYEVTDVIPVEADPIFTFTAATTDVITSSADHGLVNDDTVQLTTTGVLPAGLSLDTTYYVKTTPAVNTLTLSAVKDGTVVDITGTGTGVHTLNVLTTTITVTPSIARDSAWADGKELFFSERQIEYIVETGEKLKASYNPDGSVSETLEEVLAGALVNGTQLSLQRANSTPIVYAGVPYNFKYQFSEQFVKSNDNSINSGRLQMRNFEISYDKTGGFTVEVSPLPHDSRLRDINTKEFTGVTVGSSLTGTKLLDTGVFRVPVYCNSSDVKITVSSESWYPLAIQSADWEALQVLRNQRI